MFATPLGRAETLARDGRTAMRIAIRSGLPDDSREADERAETRRLRDLRGRVKAARALVSRAPGLSETLVSDWRKAAMFYARFGITEAQLRDGFRAPDS